MIATLKARTTFWNVLVVASALSLFAVLLYAWLARQRSIGWQLKIVRRPDGVPGFVLLPKRWVAERTFAWLNQFRRLRVRYDERADIHEAFLSLGCALICWRSLRKTWKTA